MHEKINVFGLFQVEGYGLMLSIGVIGLVLVMLYKFKKQGVPSTNVDRIIIITATGGFMMWVFAMLFNDLWYYIEYGKWEWGTGITFSGGLLGGIITYLVLYWVIMKRERFNIFYYFDTIITGIVLAHAFGRIGCYMGGCCYGKVPTTALGEFFAITFPANSYTAVHEIIPTYGANVAVLPTMLFESAFLFILFIILFFFIKKNHLRYYLVSYGTWRFLIEFLRGDDRGASPFGWLTPSQFLSVIMIVAGILLFVFGDKLIKKITKKYNSDLDIDIPCGRIFITPDNTVTDLSSQNNSIIEEDKNLC